MRVRWMQAVFGTAMLAMVAACGGDPSAEGGAGGTSRSGGGASSPDAEFVRAVLVDDADVPAELRFRLPERPAVGSDTEIGLALVVSRSIDSGRIRFAARNGLELVSGPAEYAFGATEAGQTLPYTVRVRPAAEGIGELVATLDGRAADAPFSAEFAVPVIATAITP